MIVEYSESNLHDEQILIVISQNGIAVGHTVEIVVLECLAYPRHVDIVEVKQVEVIVEMSALVLPSILPCCREDPAVELRTVLQIPRYRYF